VVSCVVNRTSTSISKYITRSGAGNPSSGRFNQSISIPSFAPENATPEKEYRSHTIVTPFWSRDSIFDLRVVRRRRNCYVEKIGGKNVRKFPSICREQKMNRLIMKINTHFKILINHLSYRGRSICIRFHAFD